MGTRNFLRSPGHPYSHHSMIILPLEPLPPLFGLYVEILGIPTSNIPAPPPPAPYPDASPPEALLSPVAPFFPPALAKVIIKSFRAFGSLDIFAPSPPAFLSASAPLFDIEQYCILFK